MNRAQRWLVAGLVVLALSSRAAFGIELAAAQTGAPLAGSFGAALALRQIDPADPTHETGQALLLSPVGETLQVTQVTADPAPTHLAGWLDETHLLALQANAARTSYTALVIDVVQAAPSATVPDLGLEQMLAVTPDGRVIGWPHAARNLLPFTALTIFDPATIQPTRTIPIPGGEGLLGAALAGFSGDSAYFSLHEPSDGLLRVDLAAGTVDGPIDLLAAGDGGEYTVETRIGPDGGTLAVAGQLDPKAAVRLHILTFQPPWPPAAEGQPRPLAEAQPAPLAVIGDIQHVAFAPAGTAAAVVGGAPGDFSASTVYLTNTTFSVAHPLDTRGVFDGCPLFTPDGRYLLFVDPDGSRLLAVPADDPDAEPEPLTEVNGRLDLCEAAWQPGALAAPQPTETPTEAAPATATPAPTSTPASLPVEGNTLAIGQEAGGTIDNAAVAHAYSLPLEAGQVVTITLLRRGGNLDPLLILLGPDGIEQARNDDAIQPVEGNTFNAEIANFSAPVSGTYTIRATRFGEAGGPSSGAFLLRVSAGVAGGPAVSPFLAGTIGIGESATGTITKEVYAQDYTLRLEAGQPVTVTLEALGGDLDPLLILFDPAGQEMARNDDAAVQVGGSALNAQIADFTPRASGDYLVRATRYREQAGETGGDFRLSVAPSAVTISPDGTPVVAGTLTAGGSVRGDITDASYARRYEIALEAGQVITVSMERQGGDLDPLLSILGPDGAELAVNDDAAVQVGNTTLNAQIVNFAAPTSGTYVIQATRYNQSSGETSGTFVLRVSGETQTVSPTPTPDANVTNGIRLAEAVAIGDSVTGQIGGDVFAVEYPITLRAGQTIAVTMLVTGGDLDPLVAVFDPAGDVVALNDDSPVPVGDDSYNAHIPGYSARTSGQYAIWASRYQTNNGTTSGTFELSITAGTPVSSQDGGPIQPGQTLAGVLSTTVFAVDYEITLRAGDTLTVSMTALDQTLDPYLSLLDGSGSEIAYNDDAEPTVGDFELNAQIADYPIPADGTYTIRATRFLQEGGTSTGRFEITVAGGGLHGGK